MEADRLMPCHACQPVRIEWSFFAINDRKAILDYIEAASPRLRLWWRQD